MDASFLYVLSPIWSVNFGLFLVLRSTLAVLPTGTPMTYMSGGRQIIVVAFGRSEEAGLLALALN